MHEYYAKKAPKLKKAMNDKEERSPDETRLIGRRRLVR